MTPYWHIKARAFPHLAAAYCERLSELRRTERIGLLGVYELWYLRDLETWLEKWWQE